MTDGMTERDNDWCGADTGCQASHCAGVCILRIGHSGSHECDGAVARKAQEIALEIRKPARPESYDIPKLVGTVIGAAVESFLRDPKPWIDAFERAFKIDPPKDPPK